MPCFTIKGIENMSIKKLPLFKNEEELAESFALYAHNGGSKIITEIFSEFMKELKDEISQPDCKKDKVCFNYQTAILTGKGLDITVLYKEFAEYAQREKITNYEELSLFMNKIKQDMTYFSGSKETTLKYILKNFHKGNQNPPTDDNIDQFLNHIKQVCPASL